MHLKLTPGLRQALQHPRLSQELGQAAQQALEAGTAPWSLLKQAHAELDAAGEAGGTLEQLCRGSTLDFPLPQRPQGPGKSPELQAHLDQLQRRLEQRRYDAMVADVTQHERAAAATAEGGLQTYKQQMSFGVHILAMMGAFYAFGHVAGMALTRDRTWQALIGLLFMFGAMVLETALYVLRTTVPPKLHWEAAKRAQAARAAQAAAKLQQELEQEPGGAPAGGSSTGAAAQGRSSSSSSSSSSSRGGGSKGPAPQKPAEQKKED